MPIKILLADDSLTIQKVVELTFSDAETRLMAVGSGDRAVQALDDFQPDIVLADVVMPGLTGYDVCEAVKARPGGAFVPVVLLTGTFEPFDRARADKVGSDAIVTKPFDSHALQGLVRDLVERGRAARTEAAPAPEPPPTVVLSAEDLEATAPPSLPVDTGSTLVLTPLDLEAAAPPPFVEAATAAPEGESIYSTMAMKLPTPAELAAAEAPAPFELAEAPTAAEAPAPFQPGPAFEPPSSALFEPAEAASARSPFDDEAATPAPLAAPAEERPAFEPEPLPFEGVTEAEVPPPPVAEPYFAYEAPPPPPPPEAFAPPPPPPPPAFYEVEAPAPPPPPPPPYRDRYEATPAFEDVASLDTAPVSAHVAEPALDVEPFGAVAEAEPVVVPEEPVETPFETEPAPATAAAAADDVEIEIEPEAAPSPIDAAPSVGPGDSPFAEMPAPPVREEAPEAIEGAGVEPFPEMEAAAPAEEPAPWDEGPAPEIPPPPALSAGPEEHPEGAEPITRDLDADMEAFEASGRVRRRPEIWERHAALIGEEVPTDIDVPGAPRAEEPGPAPEEPFPSELEEIAAAARLEDLSRLIPAGAPDEAPAPEEPASAVTTAPIASAPAGGALSDADVDRIARRVVQLLSDKAVRDIAWEVVPEYAERLVRERIAEVERAG